MDPERPKNKISWNQMKPTPSRRALRANSDDIFFPKNGDHMQNLS
jgi:hypothetical protein